MPFMQSDLAILNAEQFNIGVRFPNAGRTRSSTRPEIYTHTSDSLQATLSAQQVAGTESVTAAASKVPSAMRESLKRASTASGEDGEREQEKKRARGRPRVAIKDVTAADRRRTQIRLAQRAYRSRRENAIMLLKKRVQALKEANEAMSNAFMNLNDAAISYGLVDQHPGFARQLHSTTEVFLDLARRSSGDEDDDNDNDNDNENDEDDDARGSATAAGVPSMVAGCLSKSQKMIADAVQLFGYQARERSSSAEQTVPAPMQAPDHIATTDATAKPATQLYGGVIVDPPELSESTMYSTQQAVFDSNNTSLATTVPVSNSSTLLAMAPETNYFASNPQYSFGAAAIPMLPYSSQSTPAPQISNRIAQIPPSPYGGLSLPRSFASLEGTFGLRLLRTALEKAYLLLMTPNPPPHEFARLFGLCVMFEPIEKIRSRVFQGLDRPLNTKAPYERWGPSQAKDDCWPFTSDRAHKIETKDPSPELWSCTDIPGFENSFYDCHGTELYLRQRGVHIPAGSERIVVEVDADDFGGIDNCKDKGPLGRLSPHSSNSSPRDVGFDWNSGNASTMSVGGNDNATYAHEEAMHSMVMFTQNKSSPQAIGATSIGFTPFPPTPATGSPSGSSRSSRSDTHTPNRRSVTLDVDRFVEELSVRGTCIIRSPGFRPSDVNDAFWKAVQNVQTVS